jgi:5-methylcytosine-specific restriction enzyme B
MSATEELMHGIALGRAWNLMGDAQAARTLMDRVYDERYHKAAYHKDRYQMRVNLQINEDAASYAGWITAENPSSGPYQGTSFVWFPGESGSVAVLVIGTDGFGADTAILGRPGHSRRLRALSRLHQGRLWVKPDLLDISTEVPPAVTERWPEIPAALRQYSRVIYAATPVRDSKDGAVLADLLDLFFHEHGTPLTGAVKNRWDGRLEQIAGAVFPPVGLDDVLALLRERRFVVLEGPPGTGKTVSPTRSPTALDPRPTCSFMLREPTRTLWSAYFRGPRSKGSCLTFARATCWSRMMRPGVENTS